MERYFYTDIKINSRNLNYIEELDIPIKKKENNFKGSYLCKGCLLNKETKLKLKEKYTSNPNEISILSYNKVTYNNVWRIYCDGSSYNNGKKDPNKPAYGGYGLIVTYNNEEVVEFKYAEENWTNNIGELSGAMKGLEFILSQDYFDKDDLIIIITDSQYVSKGCIEWMDGWIKRKWKNNLNQPVANYQLWKQMRNKYLIHYNIYLQWVRGHTLLEDISSQYNERCDKLAKSAVDDIVNQK